MNVRWCSQCKEDTTQIYYALDKNRWASNPYWECQECGSHLTASELTPAELQQYHAYATACESDPALAAEVRAATRVGWEAWEQAVRDSVGLPDKELKDVTAAYVDLQRSELREYVLRKQRR